jgi:hypothetical protein
VGPEPPRLTSVELRKTLLAVAHSRQELSLDRPMGDDKERCLRDLVAAAIGVVALVDLILALQPCARQPLGKVSLLWR